jgi:hypothetical protein
MTLNRADMSHMAKLSQVARMAVAGAAALGCALLLAGCGRSAPPADGPAPTSLAKADPLIQDLRPTPEGLRVIARYPAPDMGGDSVRAASRVARQLARAVQAKAKDLPPGARTITLDLYAIDVDKSGRRTPGRFFSADFDVGDLRGLDLKAKGPAAVLDAAADLRIDRPGADPINAWCVRYPHVGSNWCDMAGVND